ncbi:D-hexose-6-phosphate mutarotase [Yersinia enterocolitica]|uniref:Putative glucose-6-phosphate 1-epimerase n=1 Tax=Yersinia enterocolitica TaxID=630 RepID=A0A9P1V2F4_YEREN|nr:D-hexose-6-phosphate mutarotase [Yersinia enterocolitica]EKN3384316.1 D-hexose-6-phosphate mutarotase [Yersinia enterocolitica]EKN3394988.1 D-hexose-6-phosphate mutarotase [Yersinia enterocolitica]EKN3443841.1 D-hexose-6-phosphate mutarotase [Yersinia enterocolitica]EKN3460943.1 D-hexose-6-phosphate mutarotase [Yersinia enterocolitica]EKN3498703.1 D-hexose-6-phosphate mutarotase [Yersinia enterocolitica]
MNEKVFTLPVVEQISPYISQRQLDELPIVVVSHPKVRAAVSLQGAHLLTFQPSGEQPIIWLSNNTPFKDGVAIRGGVPICWPWFGPSAQPSHGFARLLPWKLSAHDENENGVILTFTLEDSDASRQFWPHPFTLIARFKLGEECEMELESHGDYEAVAALHTYFQIGDISQIKISGLGEKYLDKVLKIADATQQGDLVFNGQTDRIYTHPEAYSLIKDAALKRTIEVHHHHQSDVVAWNPGAELSSSMVDMPNDGYKTMVCVETARVNKPLVAKQDSPARLAMTIRSRKNAQ